MSRLAILIVEDDPQEYTTYERTFLPYSKHVRLIHARTSAEARQQLGSTFGGIDVVILDGIINEELTEIPPSEPTTAPLARDIKAKWGELKDGKERLLVGASSSSAMREKLVKAGCDCEQEKRAVASFVAKHFGLA